LSSSARHSTNESQHVEFKGGTAIEQLQNTAVAFSNTDGGVILAGVRDDGSIAARALDAGTRDDIHRAMRAARRRWRGVVLRCRT